MSAEDVIRQRRLATQTPQERQLRTGLARLPALWAQLETVARSAIQRLERQGWLDGQLVTTRESYHTWNMYAGRVEASGTRIELAVWDIATYRYRDSDGCDVSELLFIGSNGLLYTATGHAIRAEISYVQGAVFEWYYRLTGLLGDITPSRVGVMTTHLDQATKTLTDAIACANRLGR